MVLRSTEEAAPVPDAIIRRPFTRTKVRLSPRPRRLIRELPPEPLLIPALVMAPPAEVIFCRTSSILTAPEAMIDEASITLTGLAVSISVRLIREPVTSIRSTLSAPSSAAKTVGTLKAVAATPPTNAKRTALVTELFLYILISLSTSCVLVTDPNALSGSFSCLQVDMSQPATISRK